MITLCTAWSNARNSTLFPHREFMFCIALRISNDYCPALTKLAVISTVSCCCNKNTYLVAGHKIYEENNFCACVRVSAYKNKSR